MISLRVIGRDTRTGKLNIELQFVFESRIGYTEALNLQICKQSYFMFSPVSIQLLFLSALHIKNKTKE